MKVWTAKRLWQQLEKSVLVKINVHSIELKGDGDSEKEKENGIFHLAHFSLRTKVAKIAFYIRAEMRERERGRISARRGRIRLGILEN